MKFRKPSRTPLHIRNKKGNRYAGSQSREGMVAPTISPLPKFWDSPARQDMIAPNLPPHTRFWDSYKGGDHDSHEIDEYHRNHNIISMANLKRIEEHAWGTLYSDRIAIEEEYKLEVEPFLGAYAQKMEILGATQHTDLKTILQDFKIEADSPDAISALVSQLDADQRFEIQHRVSDLRAIYKSGNEKYTDELLAILTPLILARDEKVSSLAKRVGLPYPKDKLLLSEVNRITGFPGNPLRSYRDETD